MSGKYVNSTWRILSTYYAGNETSNQSNLMFYIHNLCFTYRIWRDWKGKIKGGLGWNLRISDVERYINLMFLSWENNVFKIYTKIHIYEILHKSCSMKQIRSHQTKPIWKRRYTTETQVYSCYNYFFCIFNRYKW